MAAFYFDSQVCLKGHLITHQDNTISDSIENLCPKCGEKIISECPNCLRPLKRYYEDDDLIHRGDEYIPIKCLKCGVLFPWSERLKEHHQSKSKSNAQIFERNKENRKTVKVFVASSTELELEEERKKTVHVVNDVNKAHPNLNLEVVKWETDIPSGSYEERIQDEINPKLNECEIVLFLLYSRLGKYTREEYSITMKSSKKAFLYFKTGFSPKSDSEFANYRDVIKFREEIERENRLQFKEYDTIETFSDIFYKDLNLYLSQPYFRTPLDDEEVKSNDQEMITTGKKADRTATERKNTLLQEMESRMVPISARMVILKDNESGNQFIAEVSSFLIDKYLVTQDIYEEIMGKEKNMSYFKGDRLPVENVRWSDAVEFCNKLSDHVGLKRVYSKDGENYTADWDAKGFRLPTEAEWICACQAGKMGDRYGEINQIAWYKDNSGGKTWQVGIRDKNPWGLYDMLGNVCEWCWDFYGPYPKGGKQVWRGYKSGTHRVTPGGSWFHGEEYCTCTKRNKGWLNLSAAHLGFRLARSS